MRDSGPIAFLILVMVGMYLWLTRGSRAVASIQRQAQSTAFSIPLFVSPLDATIPAGGTFPTADSTFNWEGFSPGDFLVTSDVGS